MVVDCAQKLRKVLGVKWRVKRENYLIIHFTFNTYYELCNNDRNRVIKNDRHKFVPWGFLRKNIRSQFVLAKRSVNSRLCYYIPQYNRFDLQ